MLRVRRRRASPNCGTDCSINGSIVCTTFCLTLEFSELISNNIAISKPEYFAIVEPKCIAYKCAELISFRIAEHLAVGKPEFESICKSVHEPELIAFIESKCIPYQRAQSVTDSITDEFTQCVAVFVAVFITVELPEYISVCIAISKPE